MKNLTLKIVNYLERQSKTSIFIRGLLLTSIIGITDYLIIPNLTLSIFYLLPIILVIWFNGIWYGLSLSIFSTFSWLINDFSITIYYYPRLRIFNTAVRLFFFIVIIYLVSALKTSYEREKTLAQTDVLTGSVNRRYFFDLLQRELNIALRYEKTFTVAYFDVDDFKSVNDRFGHSRGDDLLKLVADTTQKTIRQADIFARLGGDEFALLLPETDFEAARTVLERLKMQLTTATEHRSFSTITFSIGAVTFIEQLNSVDEIIKKVDALMYQVKRSGKNDFRHEVCN